MPNYDFRCQKCGYEFTKNLSLAEKSSAACDNCGSLEISQLFRRCNVMGGKGAGSESKSAGTACTHKGGCSGCAGC